MLYFLHVPRTAGRTMFSCFLRQATDPKNRCEKSYAGLKIDASRVSEDAACMLLGSHDDWGIVEEGAVPPAARIFSQVRNPVDRVLSAYEFAHEVASRSLDKKPEDVANRVERSKAGGKQDTRLVWPWSILVPFVEQELRARKAAEDARAPDVDRAATWLRHVDEETGRPFFYTGDRKESRWELPEGATLVEELDNYNNSLTMPLADFARHPVVHEVLHNGAAFQLLGITNYTTTHPESAQVLRQCINPDSAAAGAGFRDVDRASTGSIREAVKRMLDDRLRSLWMVTMTERLNESMELIAVANGLDLDRPGYGPGSAGFDPLADEHPAEGAGAGAGPPPPRSAEETRRDLSGAVAAARRSLQEAQAEHRNAQLMSPPDPQALKAAQDKITAERAQLQASMAALKAHLSKPDAEGKGAAPEDAKAAPPPPPPKPGRPLGKAFRSCEAGAHSKAAKNTDRLTAMMTDRFGRSVKFGYASRQAIAPETLDYIKEANALDVALYELAKELFDAQRERLEAEHGSIKRLPPRGGEWDPASGEGELLSDGCNPPLPPPNRLPSANSRTGYTPRGPQPLALTHFICPTAPPPAFGERDHHLRDHHHHRHHFDDDDLHHLARPQRPAMASSPDGDDHRPLRSPARPPSPARRRRVGPPGSRPNPPGPHGSEF